MKNLLLVILFITAAVTGYIALTSKLRLSLEGLEGKTEEIKRGDLTLPINATGDVQPARRVVIKAEASGEVLEIAKQAGDRVRVGDLLIRLQKDDEQRNVNRAQLDLDVGEARLEEARLRLQQAKTADVGFAEAQVRLLEQQAALTDYRVKRLASLPPEQRNEEEMLQRQTAHQGQLAQLEQARADLERARLAIPRQEQAVKQAEAAAESARNTLGDAQKRLTKTDIISPIDGMVGSIEVQIGEVIQGGKTTLTGGTVLATVLDVTKLVVRTEADEADVGRVLAIAPAWAKPGRETDAQPPSDLFAATKNTLHSPVITVDTFRETQFEGIIERIYPEPRSRQNVVTYLVDVVITSENRSVLLPGMRAEVRFTSDHVTDAVLCPNEAIRTGPEGALGVYVPKKSASPDAHETEFVACRFGLDNGNYSEVKEGLSEGAKVYTKLPRPKEADREQKKKRE